MNSIKTLVTIAALAAVGYVVYVSINRGPKPTPPPGAPEQVAGVPNVDLGDAPKFVPGKTPSVKLELPGAKEVPAGPPEPVKTNPAPPPAEVAKASPASDPPPAGKPAGGEEIRQRFRAFIEAAHYELGQGNFAEVLKELSKYYKHPELTPAESHQLTELLDEVAGTVVYSRQHLLEKAYQVRPGETLEQIAAQHNVSGQLLAKINGIRNPQELKPGQEIKVVRGPFHAVINLQGSEMTLLLEDQADSDRAYYYAGRFPVRVDANQRLEGQYEVLRKIATPQQDPRSGLAIELNNQITIQPAPGASPGSIQVDGRDIEDIYDILSVGSRIVIRR